jgi:hypothetical protein
LYHKEPDFQDENGNEAVAPAAMSGGNYIRAA